MKAWLKGGLIGIIIGLVGGFCPITRSICSGDLGCLICIPISFGYMLNGYFLTGNNNFIFHITNYPAREIAGIIFNVIFYFLIISITLWIIGKIKSRNSPPN